MKSNLLKSIFISLILVMGVANMSAATITSDGTARLYFNMSSINWWVASNGDGNFGYFFNNSTGKNAWSAHSVKHDGNTYYVVIPAGTWAGVILTRNNTSTSPSWNNKWNQTGDITLSSTSNYISKFSEGSASVTWGTAIKPSSTGSLTTSSTSVNIGANVTLTPSLTSNQTINDINSTTYSISPNSGASISGNTFTATKAGTYTVTATITYNPDGYTSLTSTVSPTVTIEVNPWTITWNPNEGSVTPTSSTYDGATAVSLPTPTRTGYNFDGWYTAASGGTKINDIGTTTKPTSNVTYYAHWTPKTYAITLNANGGASNGSATATYNKNTVTNLTQPTRTDYRCNGYYTAASGGTLVLYTNGTLVKNVSGYTDADGNWTKDAATTLHAQWTYDVTEYAVTFGVGTGSTSYGSLTAKNNTTSASITSQAQVRSGQSVTFTATPKTGYIVEGWYTNAACTAGKHDAGNTTYTTSITGATNVYVKFVEKTWSVAFTAGTGGTVTTPSSTPQTVGEVQGITIIAETNTGYTFAGWTSSNGGKFDDAKAEKTDFYPTAATTVTANFNENLFAIAVKSSDENKGTVTPATGDAGITTYITITATPKEGYRFVNWTTTTAGITMADANNASTTVTATAAGTITANFEEIPPTTVYFKPINGWKGDNTRFAVYYWEGNTNGWIDMIEDGCTGEFYKADIPAGFTNIKFVSFPTDKENNWDYDINRTEDLKVPNDGKVLYDMASTNITTLYLNPGVWNVDGAWFPAYFFSDGEAWKKMTDENRDNIYACEIPENKKKVIFVRKNPSNQDLNFNDKWAQTGDLTIPTDGKNMFSISGWDNNGSWDKVWDNSCWTTYEPSNTYTISFDRRGATTGTESVEATVGDAAPDVEIERTGYTFGGYYTEANGEGTQIIDAEGKWINGTNYVDADGNWISTDCNITFYAQWTEKLSTITIIVSEGGSVKVDGEDFVSGNTVEVGVATSKTITLHPNAGYGISGFGVIGDALISKTEPYTLTANSNEGIGTLYANFIALTYTITWNPNGGEVDPTTSSYTYNGTTVELPNPTRDEFTFVGWFTEQSGGTQITEIGTTNKPTSDVTYYAHWQGAPYIVELNQDGAAKKGSTTSVVANFEGNMPAITGDGALPTPPNGYAFMGYFDQKDGKGTQYYDSVGTSAHTWDKTEKDTLYAYFKAAEITINLNAASFEPNSATPVIATATLKPTPVGTTSICWELLYNDDTSVAEHDPQETGEPNQVQFNINDLATGTYQIKATLREGAGCKGTIISHATQVFTITSDHTITIKYVDENGQTIKASTTQSAHVSSLTKITAPEIIGYTFKEWEAGDGVSIKDATDGKKNTITIEYNAYYDGYLKAIYTKNSDIIYFYNTLGWENVYVYFYNDANGYNYWTDNYGTGAHQNKDFGAWDRKPFWEMEHGQMEQITGTNIWYFQMKNKRSKVAFATVNQTYKEGDNVSNTTAYFQDAEVVYRDDLDSEGRLPMFVPNPTISHDMTNTKSKYYNHGYWMNYPNHSGYTLDLFNHQSNNDPARYFIYPYSQDTIFPLQIQVDINAENIANDGKKKIWFRIHRNDGKNFGGNANTFPSVKPGTTGGFITENDYKVELITPIAGTYTFILDYKYDETAKDYKYHISVDYPAAVGDYRILYRDAAEKTWSGKDKNKEGDEIKWYHASRVIKKGTDTKDIISFFINKDIRRTLSYQTIEAIDKDGNITWSKTEVEFSHVDWSQIDTSGVYNFVFVQDGRGISLDNTIEPYTGNYYIRCDAMDGNWEDYKTNPDNRMFYSAFSESEANSFGDKFSHYATKWCEAGTNVKFTIANDYSHCISDTLAQDIIPLGNLTDEGTLLNNDIYDANIRFMWNWKTNKISRAYVGPAGDKQSQFLMLRSCSEFKDAAGNDLDPNEGDILDEENDIYAARFTDTQNWIYERTIQVKPRTRVKLYASYPKVYHIYITSKSNWQDVALYAWNSENHHPLGDWPGVKPTGTVEIEGTTYYDFQVSEYVFGCGLVFHNNKDSEKTEDYTAQISQKGDYYLIEENKKLTQTKYVSTTVEATAQYFRGAYAEGSCDDEHTIQILGGEGETWNTIRVIYDFKTNRLMAAWMPNNNEIDTVRSIESDVMIIRDHQNAAQCITFANDSSKLTYVKTVYGVMRFNRWILNNRGGADNLDIESCTKVVDNQTVYDHDITNQYHPILEPSKQTSQYERALYFISFPFDVHLSDVFGFGTYGQHWIIEYYDGLKRAKEGYWIDSDPNWKYVTDPANFVLEKYKGYILCLNLGKMAYDNTDFWAHNISQVELFFPSTTTMEEIAKAEVTMPKLGEEYLCKINRGDGTEGDRRVKDSYWRCIGVPSYANYSNVLKDEEGNPIQWQTSYKTFPFLYKWNKTDNTLTPQSTTNFKFETMHAYLVQNGGEIHWSAVNATPDKPNAGIIAKVKETTRNYEWRITLTQGEKEHDQAFVRLSDDEQVTTEFDFNQDLSKEFNYGRSDIYTLIGYEKAAANSLPLSEQTTLIPLGLSIEYNGDYTIAMPDGTANIGVTLVDNQTGTRTNLSAGMEYVVTLNKGDYNNHFFIEISPIQQTPTDIEYVENSSDDQARKVLIDNILYIVRDGQIFDARGARVK